jgi:hypothetical protein
MSPGANSDASRQNTLIELWYGAKKHPNHPPVAISSEIPRAAE